MTCLISWKEFQTRKVLGFYLRTSSEGSSIRLNLNLLIPALELTKGSCFQCYKSALASQQPHPINSPCSMKQSVSWVAYRFPVHHQCSVLIPSQYLAPPALRLGPTCMSLPWGQTRRSTREAPKSCIAASLIVAQGNYSCKTHWIKTGLLPLLLTSPMGEVRTEPLLHWVGVRRDHHSLCFMLSLTVGLPEAFKASSQ